MAPTAGHNTFTSIVIDGTSGTIHAQDYAQGPAAVDVVTGIATRATTNTTITIGVNTNANMDACLIRVYRLQNLTSATADATTTATTGHAGTGTSISSTMNITAGGVCLMAVLCYQVTLGAIVGADQDSTGTLNSPLGTFSARSKSGMSAETPRSFSAALSPAGLLTYSAATWH